MKRVLIESPYDGDIAGNTVYLRVAMRDCLQRGEAPFASHALYTQPGVLNDDDLMEREQGIEAGLLWGECAELTVVYTLIVASVGECSLESIVLWLAGDLSNIESSTRETLTLA